MSHIQDRGIVITGAASGVGRLVACKAASLGQSAISTPWRVGMA